uniref:Uncharacterized protein n=1 Tax=Arundo donax TaxID=35708 RepID=A0A0A9EB19_ARUDO
MPTCISLQRMQYHTTVRSSSTHCTLLAALHHAFRN